MFSVSGSTLEINLCNVASKQVTDVILVLKDSDTEIEKTQFIDPTFCIRWPENRQISVVSFIGI